MESSSQKSEHDCSPELLHEYLDGELSREQEIALEQHLAGCTSCVKELNLQKSVLGVLDHGPEPEIPINFAEIVATKADSQVTGLRRRKERIYAIAVAAFLILMTVVLLAFDISRPMASLEVLVGKVGAFLALIGSVLANIAIGIYVIAKVFAQQADKQTAVLVFVLAVAVAACIVCALRTGKFTSLKEVKR